MMIAAFQRWLNEHGASIAEDGQGGAQTRAAILSVFTNREAPAVSDAELADFAERCGASLKQLQAVAKVESAGGGFTGEGRPKILFERHYFWRLTNGKHGIQPWSNPKGGGYDADSWAKLCLAACVDPDAAFASCSWGKFQIMGAHWEALAYPSPVSMAYTMRQSEADHYEALVRFIKVNGLQDEMRALSRDPETCRSFAKAYNGPAYERFKYHTKLAEAMR
jgi:hypothetical protein